MAINGSAQAYLNIRNDLIKCEHSAMLELLRIDDMIMCEQGLKTARERQALLLVPKRIAQERISKDLTTEDLLKDAKLAQLKLKKLLAPSAPWAQLEMNDTGKVKLDDPRRKNIIRGGEVFDPGVKSLARCEEKANLRGKLVHDLVDIARLSIVFESASTFLQGLQGLQKDLKLCWLDNKFKNPSALGYSDMNLGVEVQLDSRCFVCELQLQLRAMFDYKQGEGHKLYENIRSILISCDVKKELELDIQNLIIDQLGVTEGIAAKDALLELRYEEVGSVESLVSLMWDNQSSPTVQLMGCRQILSKISDSPENQMDALCAGALEAVETALKAHTGKLGNLHASIDKELCEVGGSILTKLREFQAAARNKLEETAKKKGLVAKPKEKLKKSASGWRKKGKTGK